MIALRSATQSDVDLLTGWDSQPHVVAATGADDPSNWSDEIAEADEWTEHLIAELDGRPIGVIQIIDPAREHTHYWGKVPEGLRAIDIWIGEASDLGHGYGAEMMAQALDRCFAPPEVTAVLIDPLVSNTRAIRFYQRIGFEPVEERTFGEDRCHVHRIDRQRWARGA